MPQKHSKYIKEWTLQGFAVGVAASILHILFFYVFPDGDAIHAMQSILVIASKPAELVMRYCLPWLDLYGLAVAGPLLVILQWTALGFIIGYWQYRNSIKSGSPPKT